MTLDFSFRSMRFLSCREYQPGHRLFITVPPSVSAPWPHSGEATALVVRVHPVPQSPALAVTVCRVQ
jgi:hypothetical protein